MSEGDEPEPRARVKPNDAVRLIIVICFAIALIFATMTGLHYTEIVKAKTLSHIITEEQAVASTGANGTIESVTMSITFTIENPSGIPVRAWIVNYKGWLRDTPYEQDLDSSRWRVDGSLYINGTEQSYFPVFVASYSFDNPQVIVPARSNITLAREITVNRTAYPDIMDGIQAIYDYAEQTGTEPEWLHYTGAIMFIETADLDVQNPKAALIRWFDGVDITPGVGGAGP